MSRGGGKVNWKGILQNKDIRFIFYLNSKVVCENFLKIIVFTDIRKRGDVSINPVIQISYFL